MRRALSNIHAHYSEHCFKKGERDAAAVAVPAAKVCPTFNKGFIIEVVQNFIMIGMSLIGLSTSDQGNLMFTSMKACAN